MRRPLAPYLRELLEASGLEWRVESGRRHRKVYVAGRMVLVVPHTAGRDAGSQSRNAEAALRRAIRTAQLEKESR